MTFLPLQPLPDQPLVSVVVPSFNQGKYIKETIDSVLSQDYCRLEVIVIDGASTDSTREILESYDTQANLTWKSEPDSGVVEAVNKGLGMVKGDIVAILSSDDLFMPHAITAIIPQFKSDQEIGFLYGEAEYIDAASRTIGRTCMGNYSIRALIARDTYVIQSSAFFRKEFIAIVGGWREQYSYVADNDFWIRICLRTKAVKTDRVLSKYRYHDEQRDKNSGRIIDDWRNMIHESEDFRSLSPDLRKAARLGYCRTALRYLSDRAWLQRHYYAFAALLLAPAAYRMVDRRDIIPGYRFVRMVASKIKHAMRHPSISSG